MLRRASSGITAAVDAAISGSESIGRAFLKASAAALKALAIESTVRAIYNTAMGLGALIFNPAAALGYFAAAGKFGLAAAAAGGGAALLGAGGGGGGGGESGGGGGYAAAPSGASYTTAGGGRGGNGEQTIIVNIGGSITASTHAELGKSVASAVRAGERAGRTSRESEVVVHFE